MPSSPTAPPHDSLRDTLPSEEPTLSTATNASTNDLIHQHQAYAEYNNNEHVLPEAVVGLHNGGGHGNEKFGAAAEKSQHGAYPEVNYAEFGHGGSLPQAKFEHANYPQVHNHDGQLPEAVNRDASPPYAVEATEEKKPSRICGMRKRLFWVVLAVLLVIIIIVAVVAGVLGSRAANNDTAEATYYPTAALAAVNYTQGNGVEHRRVYFQGPSDALYQSAWNSSTQEWHVSPLNPRDASGPTIKSGTPLAAFTKNDGIHAAIEYHVFFLDSDNKIWERGSLDPDDMWGEQTANTLNGTLYAGNSSKLAAYAQQCDRWCVQTSLVAYEDYQSKLWWAAYISDYGWYAQAAKADSNHSLVAGTSLSFAPIWSNSSSTVALYANTGTLSRFWWYQLTAWEDAWSFDRSFSGKIDADAGIAAFSLGYNGGNDTMSDIEVLVKEPGSDADIAVWDSTFSNTTFSSNSAAASTMSTASNYSAIAASAGGRVYAIEGENVVEWEWQHGNRSFTRVGEVNTDVSSQR